MDKPCNHWGLSILKIILLLEAGIEPARAEAHGILSPGRLPIPPLELLPPRYYITSLEENQA